MADASESIAVLVLGSVHRTGGGVLRKLIREGCTVVVANRIPNHAEAERETYQVGPIDLTNSTALRGQAEDLRRRTLGPDKYFNVVIYNAFHALACSLETIDQHLPVDVDTMREATAVNILSVYAAAKFAIDGFNKLPNSVPRVFIVEGNIMPFVPADNRYLSLGFGRVCQAYLIDYLASHRSRTTGERFYFAYQVTSNDGNLIHSEAETSPGAYGNAYWTLINSHMEEGWHIRFDDTGNIINQSLPGA